MYHLTMLAYHFLHDLTPLNERCMFSKTKPYIDFSIQYNLQIHLIYIPLMKAENENKHYQDVPHMYLLIKDYYWHINVYLFIKDYNCI